MKKRSYILSILYVFLIFSFQSTHNLSAQSPNLYHQWNFEDGSNDGIIDDVIGNSNGTVMDGYERILSGPEGDAAINLDTDGAYIEFGTLNFGNAFTITGHYISYFTSGENVILSGNNHCDGDNSFVFTMSGTSLIFRTFSPTGLEITATTVSGSHIAGEWNHFAIVVNKVTGTCNIYINGTDQTVNSSINTDFNSSTDFWLGLEPCRQSRLYGYLDDIRIYNRLLTSSEINIIKTGAYLPNVSYSLTTSVSPSGAGTISPSGGTYSSGQVVSVTATPASGYIFANWSGAATESTNPVSITMNGNKSLTANFSVAPPVPVTSIIVTPNPAMVPPGGTIQLTAEVLPANATIKDIQWVAMCDMSRLNVSSTGLVTATGSTVYTGNIGAWASNGVSGTSQVTISTTPLAPTVTTKNVTSVTHNSATCGGFVNSSGGTALTARGVCWSTSQNPTTANFTTNDGTAIQAYTSYLTGLSPNTTYYVRAYATNSVGTSYGEQKSFTTSQVISAPVVTTSPVTNITGATAQGGGEVTSTGNAPVTARGVCWSTSPAPTIANYKTTNGSGIGTFASSLSGLSSKTTYYVRAYATNTAGTGYGDEITFTTTDLWQINGDGISYGGRTGIGMAVATPIPAGYQLAVNGKIIATEIKVQTDIWADFVFEKDYNLWKLCELEKYIQENKHLPGIPTVNEVTKEGISLGEMNALLLKKIEELTLYMIEQEKRMVEKDTETQDLIKRIESLEKK